MSDFNRSQDLVLADLRKYAGKVSKSNDTFIFLRPQASFVQNYSNRVLDEGLMPYLYRTMDEPPFDAIVLMGCNGARYLDIAPNIKLLLKRDIRSDIPIPKNNGISPWNQSTIEQQQTSRKPLDCP